MERLRTIILLIVGLIKKILLYRMSHFLEPLMELHLSIYVTKFVSKIKTGADT